MSGPDERWTGGRECSLRRRRLLAALTAAGVGGLAGCDDTDDRGATDSPTATEIESRAASPIASPAARTLSGTATAEAGTETPRPTETDPPFVGEAEFTFPFYHDSRLNHPGWAWDKLHLRRREAFGDGIPRPVSMFVLEDFGARDLIGGGVHRFGVEDWDISETAISLHLRDDLYWSDGAEILGADFGIPAKIDVLTSPSRTQLEREFGGPRSVEEAVTDVTWDGRTWTYHAEDGAFGDFDAEAFVTDHDGLLTAADKKEMNTDRFFYRPLLEEFLDLDDTRPGQANAEQATRLIDDALDRRRGDVSDNPQDQRFSGPWVLEDIQADAVTLAPNEHHRNAPNFPRLRLVSVAEEQELWTALAEDRVDGTVFPYQTPTAQALQSVPDHFDRHVYPTGTGEASGLLLNGRATLLGHPVFRQGIARVMDAERLARAAHEVVGRPLSRPQGAHWAGVEDWMDRELIDAFASYEYDPDRAAADFRSLGMTREGGTWRRPDGSELTVTFLTSADSVEYEATVIRMLGDVGIDARIARMDDRRVTERIVAGDYELTRGRWWAAQGFWHRVLLQARRRHMYGVFEEAEVQDWIAEHDNIQEIDYDVGPLIEGYTLEQTKRFTVAAPPIGEPDAEPTVEYPVVYEELLLLDRDPSLDRRREIIQRSNWVWNYRLPVLQLHQEHDIVLHDHEEFAAPRNTDAWALEWPTPKLFWRGAIRARPTGREG